MRRSSTAYGMDLRGPGRRGLGFGAPPTYNSDPDTVPIGEVYSLVSSLESEVNDFDRAAEEVIALANRLLDEGDDVDEWEVASGILAGAIQFWLFSRQPCGDPTCESCDELSTADQRVKKLLEETRQLAEDSDYYHTPRDSNVGTA